MSAGLAPSIIIVPNMRAAALRLAPRVKVSPLFGAPLAHPFAGSLRAGVSAPAVLPRTILGPTLPTTPSAVAAPALHLARAQYSTSSAPPSASTAAPPPEPEEDEAKPRTIKERLKFLSKRYGWWALFMYMLLSTVDLSATFLLVHGLGADHIRRLEHSLRTAIGWEKDEQDEQNVAEQMGAVTHYLGLEGGADEPGAANNAPARQVAAVAIPASGSGSNASLWAEFVLAYTIHKTLLLPIRVMATAAILPSFVRLMTRWGLAKPVAQVRQSVVKGGAAAKK